ncbi:50S ribosomal protein L2 [Candidatus Kapabacteria bacterium]|nr:50S ribosomal protein L2 [Candidatus Kapabacteria bacterium]
MAIKLLKPITPGMRHYSVDDFADVTESKPYKPLLRPLKKSGGRNSHGRITSRGRSGGHKRKYRIIDFKRDKKEMFATVLTIEYDPNRTSRIALVEYTDGEKKYILAPDKLKVGQKIVSSPDAEYVDGNTLPLHKIPVGLIVHNVELKPGKGGQLARSAGTSIQLVGFEGKYAQLKLPSGEMRLVSKLCLATLGTVSNAVHLNLLLGKAGRNRWLGRKPITRGMVRNPVDHPMGGGEGNSKSGGGRKHPRSPWGQLAKGLKTRKKSKGSNRLIIKGRKSK